MWRARFGRGFGLVVRQTTKRNCIYIYIYIYIYNGGRSADSKSAISITTQN